MNIMNIIDIEVYVKMCRLTLSEQEMSGQCIFAVSPQEKNTSFVSQVPPRLIGLVAHSSGGKSTLEKCRYADFAEVYDKYTVES